MNRSYWSWALIAALILHSAGPAAAKSFVITYFYPATYYGDDTLPGRRTNLFAWMCSSSAI